MQTRSCLVSAEHQLQAEAAACALLRRNKLEFRVAQVTCGHNIRASMLMNEAEVT